MESIASRLLSGILVAAAAGAVSAAIVWRDDFLELDRRLNSIERRLNEVSPKGGSENKDIIFHDDFTGNGVGWSIVNQKDVVKRIERGKYYFETKADVDYLWWSTQIMPEPLDDFTATLKLQWITGDASGHFGLLLGWDNDNFVLLGMTPEKYSRVKLQANGKWLDNPLPAKSISEVDMSNMTITVDVRDKMVAYYLNNDRIGIFPVKEFNFKKIGIYVADKQRVEFDSLAIESGGY